MSDEPPPGAQIQCYLLSFLNKLQNHDGNFFSINSFLKIY